MNLVRPSSVQVYLVMKLRKLEQWGGPPTPRFGLAIPAEKPVFASPPLKSVNGMRDAGSVNGGHLPLAARAVAHKGRGGPNRPRTGASRRPATDARSSASGRRVGKEWQGPGAERRWHGKRPVGGIPLWPHMCLKVSGTLCIAGLHIPTPRLCSARKTWKDET